MPRNANGSPRRRGYNTGLHYTFCKDKITVGPDWKSVLGSLCLILAPCGVYFGFVAPDNGRNQTWAVPAIIGASMLASVGLLLVTALLDPGFVPRNNNPKDAELGDRPPSKEYQINGYTVNTKWCMTCNHYRPPRCSHCAICDNCTRKFDHHCPWVGNCIGERNYRYFMAFLLVTTALDLMVHAFCWVRLAYITQHDDHPSFAHAIQREPAAMALIAYTFFAFGFVGGLGGLHSYFISGNKTTYEHFRSRHGSQGNPYDVGCIRNWAEVFCIPVAPRYTQQSKPLVELLQAGPANGHLQHYDTESTLPSGSPLHSAAERMPAELAIDSPLSTGGDPALNTQDSILASGDRSRVITGQSAGGVSALGTQSTVGELPRGHASSRSGHGGYTVNRMPASPRGLDMADDSMRRVTSRNHSAASDNMSNVLTESSMGRASSFDEEVFSAHRVIPDVTAGKGGAGGSGSDFSPPNSEPFTQVTDDGSVQYEPRLDTRDLPGSGDERLGSDSGLPSIQRVSGSSESDVQTVPFQPELALPAHHLQDVHANESWDRSEKVAPSGVDMSPASNRYGSAASTVTGSSRSS